MAKNRYLTTTITEDLREKMVFIGGPRQVGKTTLARDLVGSHFRKTAYFNWDNKQDRRKLMDDELPTDGDLLILHEIHP